MLAAVIGDIVGSIYEFNNRRSKDFQFFGEGADFTDDTVLTFAVADVLPHDKPFAQGDRQRLALSGRRRFRENVVFRLAGTRLVLKKTIRCRTQR